MRVLYDENRNISNLDELFPEEWTKTDRYVRGDAVWERECVATVKDPDYMIILDPVTFEPQKMQGVVVLAQKKWGDNISAIAIKDYSKMNEITTLD